MDYKYLVHYICKLYHCQTLYLPGPQTIDFFFILPGGDLKITLTLEYIGKTHLMEIIRFFNYSISEEIERRAEDILEDARHDKF